MDDNARIVRVGWARLTARRPRKAGSNARLGEHGIEIRPPIARITTDDGATGFGFCRASREDAVGLIGARPSDFVDPGRGIALGWQQFEFPLWDLIGNRAERPVYRLAAEINGQPPPDSLQVPCYDTSLYFDDLHLASDEEAAALMAAEAVEGFERGHHAFKIKVGRGARHMAVEEGTRRDIAVVRAVREAVGPEPAIMLDANNGYNLNLAKRVLSEAADCRVFWLEEAFHEDAVLYRDLREWMAREDISVLIADGEGDASARLMDMAREKLVDVVQYDIFKPGFAGWLAYGRQLDSYDARSAPHHYGGLYGNYASCHLAAAIRNFTYVEWDEASTPAIDASAYTVRDGVVHVPNSPGFGLRLDESEFTKAIRENGYSVS